MGKTDLAIVSYRRALEYADHLSFWRGFTSTGGSLAKALASEGHLEEALQIIDRTLNANAHIPDELYFVPHNLAVKAEILRRMGRISESNNNYKRSTTLIDSLLKSSPTPGVERLLLADPVMSIQAISSRWCNRVGNAEAFTIIEKAHGRIETQALEPHAAIAPHPPSGSGQRITQLNIRLINSDDPAIRAEIEQRTVAIPFKGIAHLECNSTLRCSRSPRCAPIPLVMLCCAKTTAFPLHRSHVSGEPKPAFTRAAPRS
jgi:tetratricopeptide (TPR) repeat protein